MFSRYNSAYTNRPPPYPHHPQKEGHSESSYVCPPLHDGLNPSIPAIFPPQKEGYPTSNQYIFSQPIPKDGNNPYTFPQPPPKEGNNPYNFPQPTPKEGNNPYTSFPQPPPKEGATLSSSYIFSQEAIRSPGTAV